MAKKKEEININLSSFNDPKIVNDMSIKEMEALSSALREEIINKVAKNGGHLSASLGDVDLIVSLCHNFDFNNDKLLFDVGHQAYAYKLLTGRSLENLRKEGGTSGFQKRSESKYDVFESGHSSTAISAANGMAIVRDLKDEHFEIIAFVGDASIVNGLSFEGLNNASQGKHKIIIVLNDNDMSINHPIGGMSKFFRKISTSSGYQSMKNGMSKFLDKTRLGHKILDFFTRFKNKIKHHLIPTTFFDNMGYTYIGPISGHNFKEMDKAFKRAKKSLKSVVIHVRTKKGKGYAPAENDVVGVWHGVPPFNVETGEFAPSKRSWADAYADELLEIMKDDKNILITPATVQGSKLNKIYNAYPKRCFDVGIAEEHAFVMAAGVALEGMHPIISMYSTFLQRGYDEILHDLARMNLSSTILVDHAGLVGADGETHQGIFDESLILNLPNTVVCFASCKNQIKDLLETANNYQEGVFAIRYPKDAIKDYESNEPALFGKWQYALKGDIKDTCIVSIGPLTYELKDLLNDRNNVSIIDAIYQKPMDEDKIIELLDYNRIIIYNPYSIKSGFAYSLLNRLNELGYKKEIIIKAVPDKFIEQASVTRQLEKLELTPKDILKIL